MKLKHKLMLGPWITAAMLLIATGACVVVFHHYSRVSNAQQHEARANESTLHQASEQLCAELTGLYRTMAIIDSVKEDKISEAYGPLAWEGERATKVSSARWASASEP